VTTAVPLVRAVRFAPVVLDQPLPLLLFAGDLLAGVAPAVQVFVQADQAGVHVHLQATVQMQQVGWLAFEDG
jgi:hypothetical protein